jgi:hypothetical protein
MKITDQTSISEIADQLEADGFNPQLAVSVKKAAKTGSLLWTREKLITTDASKIQVTAR